MPETGLRNASVVLPGVEEPVLQNFDLTADTGELLAVVGPSGSGKTTVLRSIAGLVRLAEGDVVIEDRTVTHLPPHERRVAMVFESTHLAPFLDVEHNLAFGLRARHVPEPERTERVRDRARSLRMGGLLPRMPGTLSAGERGVAGIGRALVQVPSVFLLDEPLAHLDAQQRPVVRRQIAQVVEHLGVTAVYVTHDETEALAVGHRVAVLDGGRVIQVGTPRDVYGRPETCFVASFFGHPPISWLPAVPVEGSSTPDRAAGSAPLAGFRVGARTLPLWQPLPPALTAYRGRKVLLGIRPEHVEDADAVAPDPAAVRLAGRVLRTEHLGRELDVTVELDVPATSTPGADAGPGEGPRARLNARFAPSSGVRPGDTVRIAVDVARASVFDVDTGLALYHPEP